MDVEQKITATQPKIISSKPGSVLGSEALGFGLGWCSSRARGRQQKPN